MAPNRMIFAETNKTLTEGKLSGYKDITIDNIKCEVLTL